MKYYSFLRSGEKGLSFNLLKFKDFRQRIRQICRIEQVLRKSFLSCCVFCLLEYGVKISGMTLLRDNVLALCTNKVISPIALNQMYAFLYVHLFIMYKKFLSHVDINFCINYILLVYFLTGYELFVANLLIYKFKL